MSRRDRLPVPFVAAVILLLHLTLAAGAAAQQGGTVRGEVRAARDDAPLSDAVVSEASPGGASTATGREGSFRLDVRAFPARLVVTRLGFAAETVTVSGPAAPVALRLREAPLALDALVVRGGDGLSAASSGSIRELDIRLRPRDSSQELLRIVPGLVVAQHSGGGKAEQIFLRGFDADHGTDVALSVDGSPVNMVSHGHGQGYADLHFLLPEVVERIEVRKGPYDVRDGDLATAGAVAFVTRDRVDAPRVATRYGTFGSARALALLPLGGGRDEAGGYLAAALQAARGPFEIPQRQRRLNLYGRFTAPLSPGVELVGSASGFGARWNASGQIPERAVRSGLIGRFGSIDPTEGGATGRSDLIVGLRSRGAGASRWEARAFATRYRFRLFSNFTFALNDSVDGDGIEQVDRRWLAGVQATHAADGPLLGVPGRWSSGAGLRSDFADVALLHQRERVRLAPRVDARVVQWNLYSFAQRELELHPLRAHLGVRGDLFDFDVADRLHPTGAATRRAGVLSPKMSLALQLPRGTTLYANAGRGFHSNDARDLLDAQHTDRILPRALGAELGTRHSWSGGSVALAGWWLDLQSELVYVGDEGTTEPNGPTRRAGLDLEGRVRLAGWLWADLDLNLARGRYRDLPRGEDHIPLAPRLTSTGGLTAREAGPLQGGIRYRHVRSRPANEDGSVVAHGHWVWELFASYRRGDLHWFAAVDNLLDARWNEAQFDTRSRLRGEPVAVSELHFTPGSPRALQLGVEYRFGAP